MPMSFELNIKIKKKSLTEIQNVNLIWTLARRDLVRFSVYVVVFRNKTRDQSSDNACLVLITTGGSVEPFQKQATAHITVIFPQATYHFNSTNSFYFCLIVILYRRVDYVTFPILCDLFRK